ncbi:MAG TPA: P-loop NTPase fold protein [Pyrinomonadaceae bacterium]|nr:P-loop NTPase fold protein [Pyrinomonadaceae bacterium]
MWVKRDEEIVKIISYHVRKFFNVVGSFKDEGAAKTETVRAAESAAGQTGSQVAASQPTTFGYNPELDKLLAASFNESENLGEAVEEAIRALLVSPDDVEAAHALARLWQGAGEDEKAAIVYRHIQSLRPEDDAAQQALKRLQEKKTAPAGETSADERLPASHTDAHEQTPPLAATGVEPPFMGYSESFKFVIAIATFLKRALKKSHFDRETLLTSLFLCKEESSAFVALDAFGIIDEVLLMRLWNNERITYPDWAKPDNLKLLAEREFKGEPGFDNSEQFEEFFLLDDTHVGNAMREMLEIVNIRRVEFQPRHFFWGLMRGDTSGWIEETLGKRETACIKRVLMENDFESNIRREDVQEAIVADRLFVNPPAYRDSAAVDDLLGFEDYANALVDIIRRPETFPPLVVGVYGPWGAGKSTFMGLVKKKLDTPLPAPPPLEFKTKRRRLLYWTVKHLIDFREGVRRLLRGIPLVKKLIADPPHDAPAPLKVVTIEYDAWAYADTPKLWSGLIGKIARELDAELGWRGRFAYLCKRHSRALLAAVVVGLVPVALFLLGWLGHALSDFVLAQKLGAGFSNFVRRIGLAALVENSGSAGKVMGIATSLASLLYAFILQKRPVTDAVAALAARFDAAPAAGIISRIQDELKTAVQTKLNPVEKPETDDTLKSKIKSRMEQNQLKIVIFIDELDRCPLERIVDILEAIKLFLAEDIFIVFLGVDTRVAAEAIRLHYKEVKNPDLPREYLEKIVQLPLRVPTADSTKLKKFLRSFMPDVPLRRDEMTKDTSAPATPETKDRRQVSASSTATAGDGDGQVAFEDDESISKTRETGETGTTGEPEFYADGKPRTGWRASARQQRMMALDGTLLDRGGIANGELDETRPKSAFAPISRPPSLPDTECEFNCIAKLATNFLESNPRRIKRLLNTYRYVKILSNVSCEPVGAKAWQEAMLGWLAFTMKWPAFMEQAVEAAAEAGERAQPVSASNNGHTPPTGSANFLSTLLRKDAEREQQPTEQEIKKYLPFDATQITHHYQLAGNFLIENPRPYADSRAAQKQTPTPEATATNAPPPRIRKSKDAKTKQPQP